MATKYFSENEFNIAVRGADEQTIFQTKEINSSGASAKLFNLSSDNFLFFANRETMTKVRTGKPGKRVFTRKFESKSISKVETETIENELSNRNIDSVEIRVPGSEPPQTTILRKRHAAKRRFPCKKRDRRRKRFEFILNRKLRFDNS